MKTTLKIGMLAAVAALALAGCNNAIKPTEPAADSFAYNADQYYRGASDAPFTVKKIEKNDHGPTKTGEVRYHQIVVEFSHPVTKKAVEEGVKCYKLTSVANNYSMPDKTDATITDVRVDSMGTKAYLTVNTNDIDHLYVYVTASQMRAVNGALLNADKDDVWGEPGDDDYASYFDIRRTPAASLVGFVNHAKETGVGDDGLNRELWHENAAKNVFASLSVGTGTRESLYMGKTLELDVSTFKDRFLDYPSETAVLDRFANEVLNRYLKLEQYNWEKATWENVAVSFAINGAKDKWVSNITVEPNRKLRARLIDVDQIQLPGLKKFRYPIKGHFRHNGPKIVVLTPNLLNTGYLSLEKGDNNWPIRDATNDLTWKFAADMKTIEITLKSGSLGSDDNVFVDNKWVKVTADNKDSSKKSFFAGFDPATVTKDNFKCFINKDGTSPLVIKDVTVVQSDVGIYPKAFDKIIISSEDKLDGTESVYISHKVMTASFTGSYSDGGTRKEYTVPKLRFAQIAPTNDPEALYGWRMIKKN